MTLAEVLISALLLAVFFASVFEVNGICLRYINATKENVAAIEGVQDRLEGVRSLAFSDLLSEAYMTSYLTTPANTSTLGQVVTENVTLTDYVAGTPTVTYRRAPGATTIPTAVWTGVTGFPSTTTVVKATVEYTWNMSLGKRSRSEKTETIISDGVKK